MGYLALAALLLTAGLMACNKSPLDPTQASAAGTTQDTGAPAQPGTAAPDNCEQTGEHAGECGSPGGDSTETPGEAPETEGAESSGP